MKIILFQGGGPGVTYKLPGENPMAELAELLDGPVELTPLSGRLALVSREDGEAERLSIRYALHRLGREVEPIAGDCAVVAICDQRGRLREAGAEDIAAAMDYIRAREG